MPPAYKWNVSLGFKRKNAMKWRHHEVTSRSPITAIEAATNRSRVTSAGKPLGPIVRILLSLEREPAKKKAGNSHRHR